MRGSVPIIKNFEFSVLGFSKQPLILAHLFTSIEFNLPFQQTFALWEYVHSLDTFPSRRAVHLSILNLHPQSLIIIISFDIADIYRLNEPSSVHVNQGNIWFLITVKLRYHWWWLTPATVSKCRAPLLSRVRSPNRSFLYIFLRLMGITLSSAS